MIVKPGPASPPPCCRCSERGYALLLALAALLVVSLSLSIYERFLSRSLEMSRLSIAKVQADWACYGGVVRASAKPPDTLTRYEYYGTRVQVTVHDPPASLVALLLENPDAAPVLDSRNEANLRMYCAMAASPAREPAAEDAPTRDSSAEATWYYLVKQSVPPVLFTSWPGQLRSQPYE